MESQIKVNVKKQIQRLTFPEAEKKHSWLPLLLDAYQITENGVNEAVNLRIKQGHVLACKKGCFECCITHRSIPAYPIELVGITWFATEKLQAPHRKLLQDKLQIHEPGDPCVFLVNEVCSIHPMRPMACRQFNVFTKSCQPGEDAYHTRRDDVLTPIEKYKEEAFVKTMPFYGVQAKAQARKMVKKGVIHTIAKDMQQLNWKSLRQKMLDFDIIL